jgi:hypothetical protein
MDHGVDTLYLSTGFTKTHGGARETRVVLVAREYEPIYRIRPYMITNGH